MEIEILNYPSKPDHEKRHSCSYPGCSSSFNRPYRLSQHILNHSNIRPFICPEDECGKTYTTKSHLDRHINSTHKNRTENNESYSCPFCIKKYSNRQNLKRHVKINHYLNIPYSCPVCNEEFKKEHMLSTHMYRHTGIKAFSCEYCYEGFVTLYDKKRHMRYHKLHTCDVCQTTFNHWSIYKEHRKTAHVNEEFVCDECGRVFYQRIHIVRHVKTHSVPAALPRIFPCPYENCGRFYTRKNNMEQHIQSKHMKRVWECGFCPSQYSTKGKLTQHLKKQHVQEESSTDIESRLWVENTMKREC